MKIALGERSVEARVFRYPLRWWQYPDLRWFVGFEIALWEIVPNQEYLDAIAELRQALEKYPSVHMNRLMLANNLRFAGLRKEALDEYATLAASEDPYQSQLAQRLIDDESRGANDWHTEPVVTRRMARRIVFAPFAHRGRASS